MCLTFPGKVIDVQGDYAKVDYGRNGVRDNINISLTNAEVGDHVLVQGGFAIKVLTPKEAEDALKAWETILDELQEP